MPPPPPDDDLRPRIDRRRLAELTRRAYLATAGHLDLDDAEGTSADAGREHDRPRAPVASQDSDAPVTRPVSVAVRDGVPRDSPDPRSSAAPPRSPRRDRRAESDPVDVIPPRRWLVGGRAAVGLLLVIAGVVGVLLWRAASVTSGVPVPPRETGSQLETSDGDERSHAAGTHDDGAGERSPGDLPFGDQTPGDQISGDQASGDTAPSDIAGSEPPAPGSAAATYATVYVHVAGAVHEPGLVEVAASARIAQAVDAAGGAREDARLDAVNLAAPLADGQQIYIPTVEEQPSGGAADGAGSGDGTGHGAGSQDAGSRPGSLVDLNAADATELQTLPGIGPALAERVIAWRETHGPFHSVDELAEVSGIGPATLERIRGQVTV